MLALEKLDTDLVISKSCDLFLSTPFRLRVKVNLFKRLLRYTQYMYTITNVLEL